MKAYVVGSYTIDDNDMYLEYIKRVGKTVTAYGGKTIVADHSHQVLEGSPSQVVVIVEFESAQKATTWYTSSDYRDVVDFRKKSCRGWVTLCKRLVIPKEMVC